MNRYYLWITLSACANYCKYLLPPFYIIRRLTVNACCFCLCSYGTVIDGFTPPEIDLKQFISQMERHQANVPKVWSPVKKDNRHWIDLPGVKKTYGKGGGCTIM